MFVFPRGLQVFFFFISYVQFLDILHAHSLATNVSSSVLNVSEEMVGV